MYKLAYHIHKQLPFLYMPKSVHTRRKNKNKQNYNKNKMKILLMSPYGTLHLITLSLSINDQQQLYIHYKLSMHLKYKLKENNYFENLIKKQNIFFQQIQLIIGDYLRCIFFFFLRSTCRCVEIFL